MCMCVTLLPSALQRGNASELRVVTETLTWSLSGYANPVYCFLVLSVDTCALCLHAGFFVQHLDAHACTSAAIMMPFVGCLLL